MESNRFLFPKSQKIKGQKVIETLFQNGEAFFIKPFRIVYTVVHTTDDSCIKLAFAVPKKNFKKAVHRNLIKRRCREAIRLNKSNLVKILSNKQKQLCLMLIYTDKEILPYQSIESSTKKIIGQFEQKNYD